MRLPWDGTLSVLTNDGEGGFVLSSSPAVGYQPYWHTAADVNGDGKVDLISANAGDNTLTILTNDGSGDFVLAATLTGVSSPFSVVAADVNGDGKMDLISANAGNSTLSVFTNATLYSLVPAGLSLGFSPTLTISGPVGHTYLIQSASNLTNPNAWVTLTNLTLTHPVQTWVDTNVDASSPFYPAYYFRALPVP